MMQGNDWFEYIKTPGRGPISDLMGTIISVMANSRSMLGRDFRARFAPTEDPLGVMSNEKGSMGIKVQGDGFSSFMEDEEKKGRVSREGTTAWFVVGFFQEADKEQITRLLKYVKDFVYNPEEYENSQGEAGIFTPTSNIYEGMESAVYSKLVHFTMWEALVKKNQKIRESLLAIYKRSFKKEYNVMKKFSTMDHEDIFSLIDDEDNPEKQIKKLARLLVFAEIKGIEIKKPAMFHFLLSAVWSVSEDRGDFHYKTDRTLPEDTWLNNEDVDEGEDLANEVEGMSRAADVFDVILENSEINGSLYNDYFSKKDCDIEDEEETVADMAPFYTAALNNADIDPPLDCTEKQYALMFAYAINKAKGLFEDKMRQCEQLLGMEPIEGDDFLKEIWEKTSAKTITPAQASIERNAMADEIRELKEQLAKTEEKLKKSEEEKLTIKKNLITEEREKLLIKKQLEAERAKKEEIIEVPDKEPELEFPEEEEITREEKIEFLKNKKICVIGGHPNWLYKVKELFPKWSYVKGKASSSISDEVVLQTERIYFFTDMMAHVSYSRFVQIARQKNIPCSYIKAVNLDKLIDELYAEAIKDNH